MRGPMTDREGGGAATHRHGGMEPGVKQNLTGLVSYEAGSVVSRTIINRGTGTVTLFAFDEGEGLSEHTAAYDTLMYVMEGEALVTVAGVGNELKQGEGMILPAGKTHAVRATARFKMLLAMIRE